LNLKEKGLMAQTVAMAAGKTVIITGASHGIGAAIVQAFLARSYNVVAASRSISQTGYAPSSNLALVDGDIGRPDTAELVMKTAMERFGSIDHVVNDAGIYFSKPFMEYTAEDLRAFLSTNLEGFVFITQAAVRQMLIQGGGGSVTSISASLADNPMAGFPASVAMMTKGGINAITLSLANEFAKEKIRFNAVAPGIVDASLHKGKAEARSPMGSFSEPKDIADAVLYLTEASHVTGEVLHVDDGAHVGRW
jgi:NAD(P)-dependent dehydrogenase (short-subunit alcohol dehydrogenase family)